MQSKLIQIFDLKDFPIQIDIRRDVYIKKIPEGKASDVYRVQAFDRNGISHLLAIKFIYDSWKLREIKVYKEYLSNSPFKVPELIYSNEDKGLLVLEWLDDFQLRPLLSQIHLETLREWIIKKHLFFKGKFKNIDFNYESHLPWMFRDPFGRLENFHAKELFGVITQIAKFKKNIEKLLLSLDYPVTLDHSDLEIQNLLYRDSKKLAVVDWTNAIKGYGLFDIAQFRKLYIQNFDKDIAKATTIKLLESVNLENKFEMVLIFSIVKEIMLLDYYLNVRKLPVKNEIVKDSIALLKSDLNNINIRLNRHFVWVRTTF